MLANGETSVYQLNDYLGLQHKGIKAAIIKSVINVNEDHTR